MQLRNYQTETIERLISNYENNIKRNLVVFATGLGKTIIATELHKQFKPEKKTIFLVDRIELAYQAKEEFLENDPSVRVGIEMNEHRAKKTDQVIIACVATLGRKGSYRIGRFKPDDFGKIIVDEAHMSISDSFIRVLSYLGVGPKSKIGSKILVGLTATPNRTDGLSLGYLYDDITANYDISFGIKQGYLTDIDLFTINTGTDISRIHFTEHQLKQLNDVIDNPIRNNLILKSYLEHSKNENAIVYCGNVKHAHKLSELFNEADVLSHAIDANTPSEERKHIIKKYKQKEVKVLFNYGVLTTGFNAPETTTIILARPIKSDLLLRQIIGRGLRPSETSFINYIKTPNKRIESINNSTKPSCKIISLFDNIGEHRIISIPSLFGLNPEFHLNKQTKRLFKEVVEPIERVKEEKKINPKSILNLDELSLIVKNKKLNISSYNIPTQIQELTNKSWLETSDNSYEIVYPKDKKTLIITHDSLDRFKLLEYDAKKDLTKELNEFYDLSGALKAGDDYANRYYNTEFSHQFGQGLGVTEKQKNLLCLRLKGGVKVSRHKTYDDTGVPELTYRKTGEVLDRGSASRLLKSIL